MFVMKPCRPEDLEEHVRDVLDARRLDDASGCERSF
jgi:hypothetical protein